MPRPHKDFSHAAGPKEFFTAEPCFPSHLTDVIAGMWQEITCLGDEDFPAPANAVDAMLQMEDAWLALMKAKGEAHRGDDDQVEHRLLDVARCALVAVTQRRTEAGRPAKPAARKAAKKKR